MNRLPIHQIDATGTRDDSTYLRGDGTWSPAETAPTHADQLLTTTIGGNPELVWDANDEIVMTEVPL